MKIDDFMNRSKGLVLRTKIGNTIYIYSNDWDSSHDDYFLALDTQKDNLIEYENWEECSHLSFDQLHEVLNLVKELQDTPVKDRFPEKKYYLCVFPKKEALEWRGESEAIWVNCIGSFDDCFRIDYGPKTAFTEETLNNIKKSLPFIASAIDAMKIPVEDN
jgi:hypothetical protein